MADEQENTQKQTGDAMETYIGCKVIRACPMDENSFRASQGRPITQGEGAAGYMVKYPDGYTSWSPKKVFEEAYRRINNSESEMCR